MRFDRFGHSKAHPHLLRCSFCKGKGWSTQPESKFIPGHTQIYRPIDCAECCGTGIPPIPACEVGL